MVFRRHGRVSISATGSGGPPSTRGLDCQISPDLCSSSRIPSVLRNDVHLASADLVSQYAAPKDTGGKRTCRCQASSRTPRLWWLLPVATQSRGAGSGVLSLRPLRPTSHTKERGAYPQALTGILSSFRLVSLLNEQWTPQAIIVEILRP